MKYNGLQMLEFPENAYAFFPLINSMHRKRIIPHFWGGRGKKRLVLTVQIMRVFVSVFIYTYVILYIHVCMCVYVGICASVYMCAYILCEWVCM